MQPLPLRLLSEASKAAAATESIHTIDVLIWLADAALASEAPAEAAEGSAANPVAEVVAFTAQRAHSRELIEVEDTAVVSLRFRNGALGQVLGATSMYPGGERLVWMGGGDGTAELRGDKITRWDFRTAADGDESVLSGEAGTAASGGASSPFAGLQTGPAQANIAYAPRPPL